MDCFEFRLCRGVIFFGSQNSSERRFAPLVGGNRISDSRTRWIQNGSVRFGGIRKMKIQTKRCFLLLLCGIPGTLIVCVAMIQKGFPLSKVFAVAFLAVGLLTISILVGIRIRRTREKGVKKRVSPEY
jgi:hypothetical protein